MTVDVGTLETHPAADLFPMLSDDELTELADDIATRGLIESIWLYEDPDRGTVILDGRNLGAARPRRVERLSTHPQPTPLHEGSPMTARLQRRDFHRNGKTFHTYYLDGEKVPGATTILNTLSKPGLVPWASGLVANEAVNRWDELAGMPVSDRITELRGTPDRNLSRAAARGTELHNIGEAIAHGRTVDVPDEHRAPAEAYARWLDEWEIQPVATETPLYSSTWGYAGTADLWARVGARDNATALIDIKTGKGVYDETAMQLAAYRYAEHWQPDGPESEQPMDGGGVDMTLVAHVTPDSVHTIPVDAGEHTWRAFLYLTAVYKAQQTWKDNPVIGAPLDREAS